MLGGRMDWRKVMYGEDQGSQMVEKCIFIGTKNLPLHRNKQR